MGGYVLTFKGLCPNQCDRQLILSQALDQGYEVCIVFFDISKAFDTVPHLPL